MALWTVLLVLQPDAAVLLWRLLLPFIPDVGRKQINSWSGPAHFLALEVCLNSGRAPSAPPSVGLAEASVCVCVQSCLCTCEREGLEQLSKSWLP